jgi:hypothetical protein
LVDIRHSVDRTRPAEGGHRIWSLHCPENNKLNLAVGPTPVHTHIISQQVISITYIKKPQILYA